MERTFKTEGIVLTRHNFGEADKILTILTKHYGKLRVRAPGIRRITSRKAAHLEPFNLTSVFLISGKNMDIVTEAQTLNNFPGIRKDLQKVGEAYYFCELVNCLCPEKQENKEVFDLLSQALKDLGFNSSDDLCPSSDNFACQLLWLLGFLPKDRSLAGESLKNFIENITERRIKSRQLLRKAGE